MPQRRSRHERRGAVKQSDEHISGNARQCAGLLYLSHDLVTSCRIARHRLPPLVYPRHDGVLERKRDLFNRTSISLNRALCAGCRRSFGNRRQGRSRRRVRARLVALRGERRVTGEQLGLTHLALWERHLAAYCPVYGIRLSAIRRHRGSDRPWRLVEHATCQATGRGCSHPLRARCRAVQSVLIRRLVLNALRDVRAHLCDLKRPALLCRSSSRRLLTPHRLRTRPLLFGHSVGVGDWVNGRVGYLNRHRCRRRPEPAARLLLWFGR